MPNHLQHNAVCINASVTLTATICPLERLDGAILGLYLGVALGGILFPTVGMRQRGKSRLNRVSYPLLAVNLHLHDKRRSHLRSFVPLGTLRAFLGDVKDIERRRSKLSLWLFRPPYWSSGDFSALTVCALAI